MTPEESILALGRLHGLTEAEIQQIKTEVEEEYQRDYAPLAQMYADNLAKLLDDITFAALGGITNSNQDQPIMDMQTLIEAANKLPPMPKQDRPFFLDAPFKMDFPVQESPSHRYNLLNSETVKYAHFPIINLTNIAPTQAEMRLEAKKRRMLEYGKKHQPNTRTHHGRRRIK